MSPGDLEPFLWPAHTTLAVVAIGAALARSRGFTGTLAWVFAIIALPFGGAIAFFLLAHPRLVMTKRRRLRAIQLARTVAPLRKPDPHSVEALPTRERSMLVLAARLSEMSATLGNRVEILNDNVAAFARKEEAIRSARHSIWAEYYIIQNDETGNRFLDLLAARARDGLEVRLLYDAVGCSGLDPARLEAIRKAGGRAVEFLPVNPFKKRWAFHLRDHRKILVTDGELAFTGGMNVGNEASGRGRGRKLPWRDTHMLLAGPAAQDLARVFTENWSFATGEALPLPQADEGKRGDSVVAVLPSGPDQSANTNGLVYFAGIGASIQKCYVTTPYFIPDGGTLRALTTAALRGVDVRVLVPEKNDLPLMASAIRSFYPMLVEAGVRVFEYQASMLHAKTMVVDTSWCLVGSANLDVRSFRLNFEVGALVFDPVLAATLEAAFLTDLHRAREITAAEVAARPLRTRIAQGAAQLLSPLL